MNARDRDGSRAFILDLMGNPARMDQRMPEAERIASLAAVEAAFAGMIAFDDDAHERLTTAQDIFDATWRAVFGEPPAGQCPGGSPALDRAPARRCLPARRHGVGQEVAFVTASGAVMEARITVGLYDDGAAGEVFIDTAKEGADTSTLAHDAAILASVALQCGAAIEDLVNRVGRIQTNHLDNSGEAPAPARLGQPLSLIGEALDLALLVDRGLLLPDGKGAA